MAKTKVIPDEVRAQVEAIVEKFNREVVKDPHRYFSTRYRLKYLYLDRAYYKHVGPRARLTYTGDMNGWDFAIYKYTSETYDPKEWLFTGAEHVDGTVEGALKAAMKAYL
jgi:hypothetical protein